MQKLFQAAQKGLAILAFRLRAQGVRTTLVWAYGRGIPKLMGTPLATYSRITQQIYVGPQYRRRGRRRLAQWGITGVVNMRIEYDDAAHNLLVGRYCHLPTVDDAAPTLEQLEQGVVFMRQVIAEGGKVYIHCAGGVGRAPTMAVAYFVRHGLSVDDAIRLIKRSRPFINITPPQMECLRRFEAIELARQPVSARQPGLARRQAQA